MLSQENVDISMPTNSVFCILRSQSLIFAVKLCCEGYIYLALINLTFVSAESLPENYYFCPPSKFNIVLDLCCVVYVLCYIVVMDFNK